MAEFPTELEEIEEDPQAEALAVIGGGMVRHRRGSVGDVRFQPVVGLFLHASRFGEDARGVADPHPAGCW